MAANWQVFSPKPSGAAPDPIIHNAFNALGVIAGSPRAYDYPPTDKTGARNTGSGLCDGGSAATVFSADGNTTQSVITSSGNYMYFAETYPPFATTLYAYRVNMRTGGFTRITVKIHTGFTRFWSGVYPVTEDIAYLVWGYATGLGGDYVYTISRLNFSTGGFINVQEIGTTNRYINSGFSPYLAKTSAGKWKFIVPYSEYEVDSPYYLDYIKFYIVDTDDNSVSTVSLATPADIAEDGNQYVSNWAQIGSKAMFLLGSYSYASNAKLGMVLFDVNTNTPSLSSFFAAPAESYFAFAQGLYADNTEQAVYFLYFGYPDYPNGTIFKYDPSDGTFTGMAVYSNYNDCYSLLNDHSKVYRLDISGATLVLKEMDGTQINSCVYANTANDGQCTTLDSDRHGIWVVQGGNLTCYYDDAETCVIALTSAVGAAVAFLHRNRIIVARNVLGATPPVYIAVMPPA